MNATETNILRPSSVYKVRFNDCDMFGHLNNARYLDYMINARQDHLKEAYGFDYSSYYRNFQGWVISSHEIRYLKPALFDETVLIRSVLLGLDTDALHVEIQMLNETGSQLKALLRSRLTFINLKTGKKENHSRDFMDWAIALVDKQAGQELSMTERMRQIREMDPAR